MQIASEFEAGPIPPSYAKVIDIGPDGETSGVEVMPAHVAGIQLGLGDNRFAYRESRWIFVNHPHGITIIRLHQNGATSETIALE
jgi:hypothetical protein